MREPREIRWRPKVKTTETRISRLGIYRMQRLLFWDSPLFFTHGGIRRGAVLNLQGNGIERL
jgi:hypothetical protein